MESYNLYFKFIETFSPIGFANINRDHELIKEIEIRTEVNNQFFFVADLIEMKIHFCSNRSRQMLGIAPELLSPYMMNQATHADQLDRMGLAISNRMKAAYIYQKNQKGLSILSTNFNLLGPDGRYANTLFQCYTFFSSVPISTVYQLQIHTNIDSYPGLKDKFHYYCGEDLSKFRFPDDELLKIGIPFSHREFEIIKLLGEGYSSYQIGEKIFISTHTVNTHRSNILLKSGHKRIQELIAELKRNGIL